MSGSSFVYLLVASCIHSFAETDTVIRSQLKSISVDEMTLRACSNVLGCTSYHEQVASGSGLCSDQMSQ